MNRYIMLIAVALLALESWYLHGLQKSVDALRPQISDSPKAKVQLAHSAGVLASASTRNSGPVGLAASGPLAVTIGRPLKEPATEEESREVQEMRSAYAASPERAAAALAQQQRAIVLKYGLFFKLQGFTDHEIAAVSKLLFDRDNIGTDMDVVMAQARPPGEKRDFSKDAKLTGSLLEFGAAEINGLLKQELGEARFGQYTDYETNLSRYATLSALQQELGASPGNALSLKQAEEMIALFKRDQGVAGRVLLPVTDNSHAQVEVDGLRFAVLTAKDVAVVDGYQIESGYIPSPDILRQASFLNPLQREALGKLLRKRSAGRALADDFWVKPAVRSGGQGK